MPEFMTHILAKLHKCHNICAKTFEYESNNRYVYEDIMILSFKLKIHATCVLHQHKCYINISLMCALTLYVHNYGIFDLETGN